MATEVIIRGNTVYFKTNFFDVNGAATNPTTSTLYIHYPLGAAYVDVTPIVMSNSGFDWTATWDSTVSDAGRVEFSVAGVSVSSKTREDGFFILTANPANPGP